MSVPKTIFDFLSITKIRLYLAVFNPPLKKGVAGAKRKTGDFKSLPLADSGTPFYKGRFNS